MDKEALRADPLVRLIRDHENISEYVENLEKIVDKLQQHASKEDERLVPLIRENLALFTRPAGSAQRRLRPRSR